MKKERGGRERFAGKYSHKESEVSWRAGPTGVLLGDKRNPCSCR